MTPVTQTSQLTYQHCIWGYDKDENGVVCGNIEPDNKQLIDRNPNSFCNNGLWVIKDLGFYTSVNRPTAIAHTLNYPQEQT